MEQINVATFIPIGRDIVFLFSVPLYGHGRLYTGEMWFYSKESWRERIELINIWWFVVYSPSNIPETWKMCNSMHKNMHSKQTALWNNNLLVTSYQHQFSNKWAFFLSWWNLTHKFPHSVFPGRNVKKFVQLILYLPPLAVIWDK